MYWHLIEKCRFWCPLYWKHKIFCSLLSAWWWTKPRPWLPCTSQLWLQRLPQLHRWVSATREPIPVWPAPKCRDWVLDNHIRKSVQNRIWNAAPWCISWCRSRDQSRRKGQLVFKIFFCHHCLTHNITYVTYYMLGCHFKEHCLYLQLGQT